MPRATAIQAFFVAVTLSWTGAAIPVKECNRANHICSGPCPPMPREAKLPPAESQEGLCLKDWPSGACVCWLQMPASEPQTQTLFKCPVSVNHTIKPVMCVPPSYCFSPGDEPRCMIIPNCPCNNFLGKPSSSGWQPVASFILRSKIPAPADLGSAADLGENTDPSEKPETPSSDVREFSVKHLLFLLAFVIAPLICWCMLSTFFHEHKCRRKRSTPETEVMRTERIDVEDPPCPPLGSPIPHPVPQQQVVPTAPKMENPPPYREALEPGESCLLAADCDPPPSYEDAIRDAGWQVTVNQNREMDSE